MTPLVTGRPARGPYRHGTMNAIPPEAVAWAAEAVRLRVPETTVAPALGYHMQAIRRALQKIGVRRPRGGYRGQKRAA